MPKQKHDFKALKKEFMSSKCDEVKVFIENKLGKWSRNWNMSRNTKWWAKEKKELKAESAEKAIKKVWNKLAKQLEPSTEFLLWNITKAIELSGRKLEQMEEKDQINVKDLNTIRWMNRIQNWQPTTYVKEDSNVTQTERVEWILIVLPWKPIDSEKSDKNNA